MKPSTSKARRDGTWHGARVGVVTILIAWSVFSVTFPDSAASREKRPTVAVLELKAMGSGIDSGTAEVLSDRLRMEVGATGVFDLMERQRTEDILAEHGLSLSGCADQECAVRYGRILLVEMMIAGSLGKVGQMYTVSVRMFDVETSRIVAQATEDCACPIEDVLTKTVRNVARKLAGEQPVRLMDPDRHGEQMRLKDAVPPREGGFGVVVETLSDGSLLVDVGTETDTRDGAQFRIFCRDGTTRVGEIEISQAGRMFSYARWTQGPLISINPVGQWLVSIGPDEYGEQLLSAQAVPPRGEALGVVVDVMKDGRVLVDVGVEEGLRIGARFKVVREDGATRIGEIEITHMGNAFSYARWRQGPLTSADPVGRRLEHISPDERGEHLQSTRAIPPRGEALAVVVEVMKDGAILIDVGSEDGIGTGSLLAVLYGATQVGELEVTDTGGRFSYARWIWEPSSNIHPVGCPLDVTKWRATLPNPDEYGQRLRALHAIPSRGGFLGIVVDVIGDGGMVVIDVGTEEGARTGSIFDVVSRRGKNKIGEISVIDTGEEFSYARWKRRPPPGVRVVYGRLRALSDENVEFAPEDTEGSRPAEP